MRGLRMDGESMQEMVYKAGEDGRQMDTPEATVSEGEELARKNGAQSGVV